MLRLRSAPRRRRRRHGHPRLLSRSPFANPGGREIANPLWHDLAALGTWVIGVVLCLIVSV